MSGPYRVDSGGLRMFCMSGGLGQNRKFAANQKPTTKRVARGVKAMKHGKWEQAEVTEEEVINRGLGGRGRTRRTAHNRTVQRAISRAFSSSLFLCVCLSRPPAPFSDLTRTHKSTKCKKQEGNNQLSPSVSVSRKQQQ